MSRIERIPAAASAVAHHGTTARHASRALADDLIELTKPRITKMVLVSTGVGFALAAMGRSWWDWEMAALASACLIGTALSASGANALNQWMERVSDGRMNRTRTRPLPAGRISSGHGLAFGLAACLLGVGILWAGVNPAAATISLATIASYLLLYTPLKPVTPLATLVGAVPGALPPLIGWTAAQRSNPEAWASLSDPAGWSLFFIMLVWQVPHFLAIAWRHRADYAAGGHRVLPVVDPSGERTSAATLIWAVTLIPVSLAPAHLMGDRLGWGYTIVALAAGMFFALSCLQFALTRTDAHARRAFIVSIIYLPVVLVAMVVDAAIHSLV